MWLELCSDVLGGIGWAVLGGARCVWFGGIWLGGVWLGGIWLGGVLLGSVGRHWAAFGGVGWH